MKLATITLLIPFNVYCATWQFTYQSGDLKIGVEAEDQEEAFKKAAKACFKYLTKGVYPGEEKGLEIIDLCINPIKIEKLK